VKAEFMALYSRHDGNHPDAMIKDFRTLHNISPDQTHHMSMFSGIWEFLNNKLQHKLYILEEQLHAMEFGICHSLKLQPEGFEGDHIPQRFQWTGLQSWRGGD
jgi:hypothetical protein